MPLDSVLCAIFLWGWRFSFIVSPGHFIGGLVCYITLSAGEYEI